MIIDLRKYFLGASESLEWELDLSGLELGGVKPFCAPVKVHVQLNGSPASVELQGRADYVLEMPCDRCFEMVSQKREQPFSHVLVRELSHEEDDDFILVPDERLDVDQLLTEDILLDMPSKFLCSPDCKGLCPQCGKNLNEGDCACEKHPVDPRLAALKDLL